MKKGKRKTSPKLSKALLENRDFLIDRLSKEWEEVQQTAKREEIMRKTKLAASVMAKTILAFVAIGGIMAAAAVAPSIFLIFNKTTRRRGFFEKNEFLKATRYLKKKKFIEMGKEERGYSISITESGSGVVLARAFRELKIKRPPKWDGAWRIFSFDIPDKNKWARDTLRRQLRAMGFFQMQKSVFVSAFPCEEELRFLSSVLNINNAVRIIAASTISYDHDLRGFFNV